MLDMVRAIDDRFAVSLVVGHNPDLAHFAAWMCGGGDSVGLKAMRQKFPTSALAIIDFNGDSWAEIAPGAGKLERFVTPGMVGADGDD